jgi:hypothetical protein
MTSPPFNFSDDTLRSALAHIINGARIDAAFLVAETGLVVLSLYNGRKILLGVGIGPVVNGIGLLPRLPQGTSGIDNPLVAAMRAHIVKSTVRSINIDHPTIWIATHNADDLPAPEGANHLLPARLALEPGRRGFACVMTPSGATIAWPAGFRPSVGPPTNSAHRYADVSLESAGDSLVELSDSYRIEVFRRELASILSKKRQRLERRTLAVQQDLARIDEVPHLQKIGSLLLVHGKTIPRGTTETTLIDWDTNEPVVVKLAPDKPAHEQAAQFFHKARRMQRGAQILQLRLDDTNRALDVFDPLETAVRDAPADWTALQEIAARMHSLGFPVHPSAAVPSAKPRVPDERKPYHTFRSTNGATILVGRSGQDNDALVTRIAKPHDLWLHAKNIPGAHVVVPLEKNHSCPAEVLVDAATLAAHFSDARHESICEIIYVERRHVRKPKKSAPGSVTTQREKVIVVRIEKARLARLLASKVET